MLAERLSVVIITQDEALNIVDCLKSTNWASEVIVVDSGSTDGTVTLARSMGARVIQTHWRGYGPQKNWALQHASCEWILSLDADERITPELHLEIEAVIAANRGRNRVFAIPRLSNFCGHWMRHGGIWPDYSVRLFRNHSARFTDAMVHERLVFDGTAIPIKAPLLHYTYRTFEDAMLKMNRYSTLGAQAMFAAGRQSSLQKAIWRGVATFFKSYVLQKGFLCGWPGVMLANHRAQGVYSRFLKLWLLGKSQASMKVDSIAAARMTSSSQSAARKASAPVRAEESLGHDH